MRPQVGILLRKETHEELRKFAEKEYSTPAAIGRKCIELALPIIMAGVPASALEAMGGKRRRK